MSLPKVVVVTRTQNRPLFLARAIKSIHGQTYDSIEHVIYNDAGDKVSVNKTINSVEGINKSVTVNIIHNDTSCGMESASNNGIRSSKAPYIAIHDDDDSWHPEMLQRAVEVLESSTAMGVVVRTNKVIEQVEADGSIQQKKVQQWLPNVKAINLYRQCIDNQMTPITFVYRREAFDQLDGYDESLPVCGDWDFGIRFLQKWDVEYLDPGFALANYHHRVYRAGAEGNSNFAGNEKHRYYSNLLMNRYLRQELSEGRLGVGYIMSKLRYDESRLAQYMKRILPSGLVNRIKKTIQN